MEGKYPFELHLDYVVRQGGHGQPKKLSYLGDGNVLPLGVWK